MRRDEQGTIHVEGEVSEVTECNFEDEMVDGPIAFCLHGETGCPAEEFLPFSISTWFRVHSNGWFKS